jgi:copper(I)-binding protein
MGSRRAKLAPVVFLILLGLAACRSKDSGPRIEVSDVWSRPGAAGQMEESSGEGGMGMGRTAGTGAVFMTLENQGQESDRLLSARTDVAQVVEIHETRIEGDVAKMQQVTGGIEIPAQGQVALKPGGYHVMLIGLLHDLAVGDQFSLTLTFEKSGDVTLQAEVRQP